MKYSILTKTNGECSFYDVTTDKRKVLKNLLDRVKQLEVPKIKKEPKFNIPFKHKKDYKPYEDGFTSLNHGRLINDNGKEIPSTAHKYKTLELKETLDLIIKHLDLKYVPEKKSSKDAYLTN
jgi:hypothetical protein